MYILKPLKSIRFTKDDIGTVEEVVRETKLVDKGIEELTRFSRNAPGFERERRKFLKHAAVLAGLYATGQLLKGCATVQEPVTFQGKTYGGWEAHLLTQDLVRGPRLLKNPGTGMPSEFQDHQIEAVYRGREAFGAVDYEVPVGTPIVPTADVFRTRTQYSRVGGNELYLVHRHQPRKPIVSAYVHLDNYSDIVPKGKFRAAVGVSEIRDNELDKLKIVAFSGATGIFFRDYYLSHLHFQVMEVEGEGQIGQGHLIPPGLDPFELGIDADKSFGGVDEYGIPYGGRPIYSDGKTEIPLNINQRKRLLQKSLDTLDKRVRESDLDKETKDELLKRHNNPEALRDYLGTLVLKKHTDKDGKLNYRHLPGSLPYALMLAIFSRTSKKEILLTLPFISPFVKGVYQQANQGVKF